MPSTDLRTPAIILRRTNYGESDRILSFLTPSGKISTLARGVRKEKSKLAGSIELFSVADIVVHRRPGSDLGILTGAKMLRFYGGIIKTLPSLELASDCLKRLDRTAEQADNPEYFSLLEQVLNGLDTGLPHTLISTWFDFNLARASGEELNLLRDTSGAELSPTANYLWDTTESALRPDPAGPISAREIKLARLILVSKLSAIARVQGVGDLLPALSHIAQATR